MAEKIPSKRNKTSPILGAGKTPKKKVPKLGNWLLAGLIFLIAWLAFSPDMGGKAFGQMSVTEVSYTEFKLHLLATNVVEVNIVDNSEILYTVQQEDEKHQYKTYIPYPDEGLLPLLESKGLVLGGEKSSPGFWTVIMSLIPWIFLIGFFIYMSRQVRAGAGQAFSFGRSRARRYDGLSKILFKDVAGQIEAKAELEEVVEYLKSPQRFIQIGARIPRGVLLIGPPGTGKTLLARAVAGEASVTFLHISGSDFVEMFVGVGASRVRDLFDQARKASPCIVFIDELDAVGRSRGDNLGRTNDEREQTLNQILVEMDGFDVEHNVVVIAATNRPDVLDPALLRPGRFDRHVSVSLPDIKERLAILQLHAVKVKIDMQNIDMDAIARTSAGFSGADLANLINEAALLAARRGSLYVEMCDLEEAREKVMLGVAKRSMALTDKQKEETACHEAGHALLHFFVEDADPLYKVTIVPRGRALGLAYSLPREDRFSMNRNQIISRIQIMYGGYAAEELIYGWTSAGVSNDLQQATDLARRMVTQWGMSQKIGPYYISSERSGLRSMESLYNFSDQRSEATAAEVDAEIKAILSEALEHARDILRKNEEVLRRITQRLLEKETLDASEVRQIIFPSEKDEHNQESSSSQEQQSVTLPAEGNDSEKLES